MKVWEAACLPFGGGHVSTGDTLDPRFPGQWFQAESGLHQNQLRDDGPTTGQNVPGGLLALVDAPDLQVRPVLVDGRSQTTPPPSQANPANNLKRAAIALPARGQLV